MTASYEKYVAIRDKKGMKDSDVARLAGISQTVLSEWKKGKATPKIDKIQKIAVALQAKYFDLEDIADNREIIEKEVLATTWDFSDDELLLIDLSRSLNEEGFAKLRDYLDDLLLIDKYTY